MHGYNVGSLGGGELGQRNFGARENQAHRLVPGRQGGENRAQSPADTPAAAVQNFAQFSRPTERGRVQKQGSEKADSNVSGAYARRNLDDVHFVNR